MKNPKLTLASILSVLTVFYTMISDNAEILGVSTKTLMFISLGITAVSAIWKIVSPEESLFTKAKHVGTRPKNPPKNKHS